MCLVDLRCLEIRFMAVLPLLLVSGVAIRFVCYAPFRETLQQNNEADLKIFICPVLQRLACTQ